MLPYLFARIEGPGRRPDFSPRHTLAHRRRAVLLGTKKTKLWEKHCFSAFGPGAGEGIRRRGRDPDRRTLQAGRPGAGDLRSRLPAERQLPRRLRGTGHPMSLSGRGRGQRGDDDRKVCAGRVSAEVQIRLAGARRAEQPELPFKTRAATRTRREHKLVHSRERLA